MTVSFNVTGKERKALAQALSEITFSEVVYAGAPSFDYQVGDYIIDKNGVLSYPDTLSKEAVALVVEKLSERGFAPADEGEAETPEKDAPAETPAEMPDVAAEAAPADQPEAEAMKAADGAETPDVAETPEAAPADPDEAAAPEESEDATDSSAGHKFAVSIPRISLTDDALERLKLIVANKEVLFRRAVLADTLPVEVTEEEIAFPWFTLTGADGEAAAYTQFITALCQMAREQTRVLDKPYDGDNDRFAMRIFMVRLGMKGAQYALARKLMLNHLTGNSGWRYGAPPKKEAVPTASEPAPAFSPEEPDGAADAEDAATGNSEEASDEVV